MITALLLVTAISPFRLPVMNGASTQETFDSAAHPEGVFVLESFQLRCGYCSQNAPAVDQLARFYSYEPRVLFLDLGIDRDRRDFVQWIQRHSPSFPVVMDEGRRVFNGLSGSGTPTTWVLDCKLNVAWSHSGVWDSGTRSELKATIDRLLEQSDCTH